MWYLKKIVNSYEQFHSKNRLLTVKQLLSPLKDFRFKIGRRGIPLTVKRLSFQLLTFLCQSISLELEIKSFVVQRKYNFGDKGQKLYDII